MDDPSNLPPLTTEQLAARWQMAPDTLQVWRTRGKGPKFFKAGKSPRSRVLYPMEEVKAYERNNTKGSTREGAEENE